MSLFHVVLLSVVLVSPSTLLYNTNLRQEENDHLIFFVNYPLLGVYLYQFHSQMGEIRHFI
jgi:hypothetical protein